MASVEIKNFDSPTETRPFEGKGQVEIVDIAGHMVGKVTFEPGVEVVEKRQTNSGNRLVPGRPRIRVLWPHEGVHGRRL